MRFDILGPLEVHRADGSPVSVGGPRVRTLLTLLLLEPGRIVGTDRLVDGLWGAQPPVGAGNALQSQVSRLRQVLGTELVEHHPTGYRLAVDPEDVDTHRFERLAAAGRETLAAGDPATAARSLREALGLWRGSPLADLPAEYPAARHLDELRLAVTEDRIEADLALGEHRSLIPELRGLIDTHPLRERLRAQLMRALHAGGRQADALAEFEAARHVLAEQLGIDPSAELTAAHLAVLRAEPPVDPRPNTGLPSQLTSFVGRREELARVRTLLTENRLVTLTGPGGAGKTRLAVETARQLAGEVVLAELAPLAQGGDLPQAVLAALGLRETGLRHAAEPLAPVDRLIAALTDRPLLLILDNCEHLIDAAAGLVQRLLGACGSLRILATSREPLDITGETLCPVPTLARPPAGSTPAEAPAYPAVRLFAERAAAVAPGFGVDERNLAPVLRICEALDGLPLAIELAAARVRSLPVTEIAARLDDRFQLLSRGNRTAEHRHRTLRAVVAWSWDALDEAERALARRLTVFSGGATLDAIRRVCGAPGGEILDLLAALTEKSLVELGSDGRYRMLETVRAFGAEQLEQAGERESLLAAHWDHFHELATFAEHRLRGPEQLEWLRLLAEEHDNLNAALRRAIETEPATALRLLTALTPYWWMRGLKSEGAALAADLLGELDQHPPAGLEEEYVACVSTAAAARTRPGELQAELAIVLDVLLDLPLPPRQPFLLLLWGMAYGVPRGDDEAITRLMNRQRELAPDTWSRALSEMGWGLTELYRGHPDRAERDLEAAAAGFRSAGDRWGLAMALASLGTIVGGRGDRSRAAALLDESIALTELLGADEDTAESLCARAELYLFGDDPAAARADFEHALELARRSGTRETIAGSYRGLADLHRWQGELDRAQQLAEAALAECPSGWFAPDEIRTRTLQTLGWIAEARGEPDRARQWHRQALDTARVLENVAGLADTAEGLAAVALHEGGPRRAATLLGLATTLRGCERAGDVDVARVAAGALAALGEPGYAEAYAEGRSLSRDEAITILEAEPSAGGT
ncbi:BTAD domain-containing putative transcriptional regulator [Amycolatopsis cihanbeyliensis]|uniref:Putative ATPase n=1 Tax=Amycolatopsis cihanbeyliensis TaxID=1128664 RepID=A0A542DM24_AMYCI|nr:BTAD domain-containing putative transcriptional regulator [Amycolatopsis cihanbeyliensis]TQJ04141.1 putative ATPase [Amycolatopsis cihanbeyliensis]